MNINRNTLKKIIKEEMSKLAASQVKEEEQKIGQDKATSQELKGAAQAIRGQASASGVSAQERALIMKVNEFLIDAAKQGNIAQTNITRRLEIVLRELAKMSEDPEAEDQQKP